MLAILRTRSFFSSGRVQLRQLQTQTIPRSLIHTTSALQSGKHTADSYSKDIDPTPPIHSNVHRVDADAELVQKPTLPRRPTSSSIHTTPAPEPEDNQHSTDTYSKDVDSSPPADGNVYRIDPNSELVQKPYEPPSGEWSRAGVLTEEYRHVEGAKQPYTPKGGDEGRYGARDSWTKEKGPETSGKDEGPEGKSSGGRK